MQLSNNISNPFQRKATPVNRLRDDLIYMLEANNNKQEQGRTSKERKRNWFMYAVSNSVVLLIPFAESQDLYVCIHEIKQSRTSVSIIRIT
jgi:hypothetical protein